ILKQNPEKMGDSIINFTHDDYNKKSGATLIDAKNDSEAISSFLSEYKDSPQTLRSYAKEIERLLLWCIHVSKVNISSLRRDHFIEYQQFLKKPIPEKNWCGPNVGKQKRDGSINPAWRPFVKGLGESSIRTALN